MEIRAREIKVLLVNISTSLILELVLINPSLQSDQCSLWYWSSGWTPFTHIIGRVLSNTPAAVLLRPLAVGGPSSRPPGVDVHMSRGFGEVCLGYPFTQSVALLCCFYVGLPQIRFSLQKAFCSLKKQNKTENPLVQSNLYVWSDINLDHFQTREDLDYLVQHLYFTRKILSMGR